MAFARFFESPTRDGALLARKEPEAKEEFGESEEVELPMRRQYSAL